VTFVTSPVRSSTRLNTTLNVCALDGSSSAANSTEMGVGTRGARKKPVWLGVALQPGTSSTRMLT
jgi:hypothetical protein